MLSNHAIEVTARIRPAGTGNGGCTAGTVLASAHLRGKEPFRRGLGDRRRQPVRVFLAAHVRPGESAADSSDSEPVVGEGSGMMARGWPAIVAVPTTTCRSDGRWLGTGQQSPSSRPPFGPGRHGIRVLAFRGWAAEAPMRPKRYGCAANEIAERVQRLDAAVPDPGKDRIALVWLAHPGFRANPQGDQVQETISGNPALICVMIGADRQGAGGSGPQRWCGAYGGSGGQVGSGDRASLPGRSTRYRVIWLVCPRCETKMECVFYDEGDRPLCVNSRHGRMEVQR